MSRGTTLLELLLVLTIIAIVTAVAGPSIGALRNQLLVEEAAAQFAGAHARARLVASVEQRVVVLTLTADSLTIAVVEGPGDTVPRWKAPGPAVSEVSVTGVPRSVGFAPTGIAFGFANATYGFTRGAAQTRVIVSRYGRVRRG